MYKRAYISGALTQLGDTIAVKGFYERLAQVCIRHGLEAYLPHMHTDPVADADITPSRVYETDRAHISGSDLLIAYVGIPSLGVGQEIEIARQHDIDVILLCERGRPLSRMARGSPNVVATILFDSFEDALRKLRGILGVGCRTGGFRAKQLALALPR